MADSCPDSVKGNLYQITLGRITNITEEDDICQGLYVSPFSYCDETQSFGVCHSYDEEIEDGMFVINEKGCLGFFELNDMDLEKYLLKLLKKTCKEDELKDALTVALIQDDADYYFRESKENEWITSIGEMGEINWDGSADEALKKFQGALAITVTPYYEQNIDLTALPCGAPLDDEDEPADHHEFCGVRVIR